MANRIIRPLRELTGKARRMADGDWLLGMSESGGRDEIGQLSDTLNTLAAELNKREKVKNDFIYSVSHELSTPLASIKGWSQTLSDREMGKDELQAGLSIISQETERLTGLVEDLLEFSELTAGGLELHQEELDLNLPVRECLMQQASRQDHTGVRLISLLEPEPLLVLGDSSRLRQVVVNLLDNAFKFTPAGGTIRVSAGREGQEAIMRISDSGVGIPQEDLPHVMDKFYKGCIHGLRQRPGTRHLQGNRGAARRQARHRERAG